MGDEPLDSGPFCQHWAEPGCCDEVCVCGHGCWSHDGERSTPCVALGCKCQGFILRGQDPAPTP